MKIKSLKYFLTIRPFTNFEIFNDHLKQGDKYYYKGEKLILEEEFLLLIKTML